VNLSSPAAVRALMSRHGLRPRRRFGQNFLADANVLAKIAAAGDLAAGDCVVEIGSGLGVLTQALAAAVGAEGRVVTIEVDRSLIPVLAETVGSLKQVSVVTDDALSLNWPEFLSDRFGADRLGRIAVIANIPYNITSPLLSTLLPHRSWFRAIVFLVQKEVGLRLCAAPATPDYGALSVFVQYQAAVEIVANVSRTVFFPVPDVDSAIVRLVPYVDPPVAVADEALFQSVVRAAFGQRRKSLLNALSGDPSLGWSREQALAGLATAGIEPGRRGETLSVAEFARLASFAPAPLNS